MHAESVSSTGGYHAMVLCKDARASFILCTKSLTGISGEEEALSLSSLMSLYSVTQEMWPLNYGMTLNKSTVTKKYIFIFYFEFHGHVKSVAYLSLLLSFPVCPKSHCLVTDGMFGSIFS